MKSDGDREFLDEIYEGVVRWNRWWFEQNDTDDNGLCEYQHPFSSGLDDSPLWDDGMPVEAPDLNTYLVLQEEALAKMAGLLGLQDDADDLAQPGRQARTAYDRPDVGFGSRPILGDPSRATGERAHALQPLPAAYRTHAPTHCRAHAGSLARRRLILGEISAAHSRNG